MALVGTVIRLLTSQRQKGETVDGPSPAVKFPLLCDVLHCKLSQKGEGRDGFMHPTTGIPRLTVTSERVTLNANSRRAVVPNSKCCENCCFLKSNSVTRTMKSDTMNGHNLAFYNSISTLLLFLYLIAWGRGGGCLPNFNT